MCTFNSQSQAKATISILGIVSTCLENGAQLCLGPVPDPHMCQSKNIRLYLTGSPEFNFTFPHSWAPSPHSPQGGSQSQSPCKMGTQKIWQDIMSLCDIFYFIQRWDLSKSKVGPGRFMPPSQTTFPALRSYLVRICSGLVRCEDYYMYGSILYHRYVAGARSMITVKSESVLCKMKKFWDI